MTTHLQRAEALLDLERNDQALVHAGLAVAESPDDGNGHLLMARALWRLGRTDEAIDAAHRAIQTDPEWHGYHFTLALFLYDQGRNEDALAPARTSVQLRPDNARNHAGLARVLARTGQAQLSRQHLDTALQLDPQDTFVLKSGAILAIDRQDWVQAEDCLRRSLTLQPTDPVALNNLGVALNGQGKARHAALAFKAAVMADPTLKVAKENAHDTLRLALGGAGVIGALGVLTLKVGTKAWMLGAAVLHLLRRPAVLLVAVVFVALAVVAFVVQHRKDRRALLAEDPQLEQLFATLAAERKAGRL